MPAAQIYEVELPDGRILEVEGDRPPTRAELARYLPEEKPKPEGILSRFDRFMRTPVAGNSEFSATNQAPSMSENTMAPGESRATTSADASKFKQLAQAPLLNLPRVTAEDVARLGELQTPDLTTGDFGRDRRIPASVAGGLYNAAAPIIEGLSSPQNIAITAALVGVGKAAQLGVALGGVGKAAQLGVKGARLVLGAAGVGFGAVTAKDTIALAEHAGEVLADPTASDLKSTEAVAAPVLTALLSASMLAGGARIGAAEAVPALAQAYPKAFWKRSGITAEEFAQVYPATLRRVDRNQGTPADLALVQRVNDAASEAGVSVRALARGRATADVIDWNPRAITKLLPEDLRPAAPASEVRFHTPAARPSAPVPVPGEPLALEQGQNRPSAPPPVDERLSAPAQVAPPEPAAAPVDNAPVVATPAKPLTPDEAPTVLADGDVIKAPRAEIAQRPDLMQFKRIDEGASGVNAEDKLTGAWDPLKGGLLLLWEPATPSDYGLTGAQRYIVANGHHRVEFGDRVDNKIYNAQVLREANGYSVGDARRIGAEINIADGKGNIYDQAKFVRDIAATHGPDEALAAARRIGARGRKATNIGIAAGPDAFDAFINERIGADHAEQIALAAPGNDGLQRVGVGAALRGANAQEAANLVRAAAAMPAGPQGAQGDLFGADDSALLAMEAQAKRATAIQNQLTEDIRAVQGAAKNPAAAKKYGVDVKDEAGLEAKLTELKALRARWDNWHLEPDLVAQVRPAPVAPVVEPAVVAAPPPDPNQIDMFGGEPPSAPPTKLAAYNGSALLPPPEKLDLPMQPERPLDNPGEAGMVAEDPPARLPKPSARAVGYGGARAVISELENMATESVPAYNREPGGRLILDGNAIPFLQSINVFRKTLSISDVVDSIATSFPSIDKAKIAQRLQAALDGAEEIGQREIVPFKAKMFRGETGRKAGETIGESWTSKKEVAASYGPVSESEIALGDVLKADKKYLRIEPLVRGSEAGEVSVKDEGTDSSSVFVTGRDIIEHVSAWLRDQHGVTSPLAVSKYLKNLGWDGYAMSDQLFVFDPANRGTFEIFSRPITPPRRGSSAVGDPGPLEPGMPPIPPGVPAGNLNYGRMPVAMERMAPGTVDVPTVLDALRAVAKAAGSMTDIREGRFSQNALGIAKSWEEIIRVRQLNNLPTAAHEVGHIVSKAIFGSMKSRPMMRQAFPAPVIKELQAMGKALYGSTKPVAGYTAEGFAELVRLWLSTEDAARRAPLATKWLEETLFPLQSAKGATPSLGQAMRYARDQFDLWRAQGAEGRISAQTKDEPGRWQRVKTWAKENLSGRAVGEEFAPLEELAKAYTATTGNRLAPGENPYMIATALRGTAGAKLETWVDHAMTDINGTVTGPGLREAVAPVRSANAEEFQIYLTVRQAIERLKQGKNPGLEPEDLVYVRDKYEKAHPEFIAAAEGMADWWAGVLNYVEQAWPDKNSQVIAAVRKGNPRYFGPLARVLDSDRVRPGKAEGTGGGIHRFKGSGLPIKKLLLQSLYVAEGMIAQAHRDAIARSVFRLAEVEGMGWIVEEVPITKAMEQVNIEKLRSQLEAMGVDTSAIAPDEMLSYATTRDTPTGIDPIIPLDTANGKRWFQVPAMVFEILEGVQEPARLGAVFELFAGMPARAFKLGTTGVRASFSLVTNPARDLPTFMLQSIAGNPASRVANYFGALAGIVKAGLGGNQSPAWELVHALGLQSSTFLGGDIAQARREAKGMFHGKFYRRITSPVETLREILSFTETAPRMAELEMIGRELGWKPGQPLTRDQAVAMAVAFKRVTTDFSAKGSKWRGFYRSVPFANAAVQGARALGRAFSRDQGTKEKHFAPLRAVLNGLTLLTLPAIWNYWANKDEEWFKMLPWRERYLYLNVSQGRNVYQIPLPPEWASAFAVLPVAALDSWYHDDRKALVNALEHVLSVVNPLDYPVLAKVAKEQWSNKIEFFNRPMVPRGEIDLLPGSQRGPYTSEIGAELGNIFPNQVSPRRFDAAVRAVFGGVGGDVIDAPGALMRALGLKTQIANREMEPSDIPVLGRLARRGGQFTSATQPLTEFWDDYNRYSAWKASNHKAITERTPVLEPMSFQEQAYGMKLALLEPYIKLRMEIAARTPELDKRQAIYKATSERARKLLESKPKSAQNPPAGLILPLREP